MERAYAIDKVFTVDVPALEHGHDGLIFTCVRTPYQFGTDTNMCGILFPASRHPLNPHGSLKWKPPSENSIDFKLVLRFPPTPGGREVDWTARPVFALHTWLGGARYEPFDVLDVDDAEWAAWKAGGEQVDDRIVEVTWDARRERWRKMRFRDDKPNANHRSTVDKIMASIADGVEQETVRGARAGVAAMLTRLRQLVARVQAIKQAWKAREGQPANQPAARPVMEMRYGPMVKSRWSKASGPQEVAGVRR
jgi:mRNA guanylyltransferase